MGWENEADVSTKEIYCVHVSTDSRYDDLKHYLTHWITPQYLYPKNKSYLRLKSTQYDLIDGLLFHKNYDGVLSICL